MRRSEHRGEDQAQEGLLVSSVMIRLIFINKALKKYQKRISISSKPWQQEEENKCQIPNKVMISEAPESHLSEAYP